MQSTHINERPNWMLTAALCVLMFVVLMLTH
jgi:hypothetical protein